jgi:hypothetical protein
MITPKKTSNPPVACMRL